MARPGPWEGRIRQWVVKTGESMDDVVVVYLVDPPEADVLDRVRMPARFFKIWREPTTQGEPMDWLVFVGHGATVQPRQVSLTTPGAVSLAGPMFLVIVLLVAGYWVYRRKLSDQTAERLTPVQKWRQERQQRGLDPVDEVEAEAEVDLPEDPVEALQEMQRRRAGGNGEAGP
jgi:hypothetical protein